MSEQLKLDDETLPITLRRAWDRALRMLASRVNKPTFEAHIRSLRPVSLTEAEAGSAAALGPVEITLGVPSAFTREWVEKRHASLIAGLLEEILDRDVRLRFALLPKEPPAAGVGVPPTVLPTPAVSAEAAPATADGLFELPAVGSDTSVGPNSGNVRAATPVRAPAAGSSRATRNGAQPATGAGATTGASAAPVFGASAAPLLNERYTFDTFVIGPSNRLAHAGAQAVAQAPGQVYNPLFLYGPSGLGKTHLMHAIGNQVVAAEGGASASKVAYISGESFTTHFVTSLRERRSEEFRRRWRNVDVLLVDDIQFIASKELTKEEFFHTFNALYQTGKQIVISSDRSPRELRAMDERLRSRFESGLIADIAPPNLETRLAILQKKAEFERMRIPDDVLLYMAKLVQSNIRTLEGALVKLIAYASLVNSPVTTQLAADILERYFIVAGSGLPDAKLVREDDENEALHDEAGESARKAPSSLPRAKSVITGETVQRVVARKFNLSVDALVSQKRDREVSHARQIAMHLVRELTEVSLPGIGQLFGGRAHSTTAHACDRIRDLLPFDDDLKRLVEDLISEIQKEAAA